MTRTAAKTKHSRTLRDPRFEFLRLLLMLMMLVMHYLSRAGALIELERPLTSVRLTGSLIESFAIVCVNCFVLITGYFLSGSSFRLRRLIELILEVYFYTIVISLVMRVAGLPPVHDRSLYAAVQYLFPLSGGHYWFVSAYILLYILSPVLNAGVKHLSRKELMTVISALIVFFSLIKSFVPVNFVTDDYGYGFRWFIVMYLTGAYMAKYGIHFFNDMKKCVLVYVACSLIIFVMTLTLYLINARFGGLNYFFSVTAHYNHILIYISSVALFSLFHHIPAWRGLPARVFTMLSPYVLGVYLLHEHMDIRDRWFPWMEGLFGKVNGDSLIAFLPHFALSVLLIFFAGLFIDWVRGMLFRFVSRLVSR